MSGCFWYQRSGADKGSQHRVRTYLLAVVQWLAFYIATSFKCPVKGIIFNSLGNCRRVSRNHGYKIKIDISKGYDIWEAHDCLLKNSKLKEILMWFSKGMVHGSSCPCRVRRSVLTMIRFNVEEQHSCTAILHWNKVRFQVPSRSDSSVWTLYGPNLFWKILIQFEILLPP